LYAVHCLLPSFPTRRSSDLPSTLCLLPVTLPLLAVVVRRQGGHVKHVAEAGASSLRDEDFLAPPAGAFPPCVRSARALSFAGPRSEEHTSELQSRGHLVCRL